MKRDRLAKIGYERCCERGCWRRTKTGCDQVAYRVAGGVGLGEECACSAGLCVIGDEILSGRTEDRNVAQIGLWLNLQGVTLTETRVVPDREDAIIEAVNALRPTNDYLFTTGGIGPTHDDITIDSVSKALGLPVVVHPGARAALERYFASRGGLTEARLRMARTPLGAQLIDNCKVGPPVIRIENIFILAGVPNLVTLMLESLSGALEGGIPLLSVIAECHGSADEFEDLLRETEAAHRACQISAVPLTRKGAASVQFIVRSINQHAVEICLADLTKRLMHDGRTTVRQGRPIWTAID